MAHVRDVVQMSVSTVRPAHTEYVPHDWRSEFRPSIGQFAIGSPVPQLHMEAGDVLEAELLPRRHTEQSGGAC